GTRGAWTRRSLAGRGTSRVFGSTRSPRRVRLLLQPWRRVRVPGGQACGHLRSPAARTGTPRSFLNPDGRLFGNPLLTVLSWRATTGRLRPGRRGECSMTVASYLERQVTVGDLKLHYQE